LRVKHRAAIAAETTLALPQSSRPKDPKLQKIVHVHDSKR
jgi:hypothetical protein